MCHEPVLMCSPDHATLKGLEFDLAVALLAVQVEQRFRLRQHRVGSVEVME